MFSRIPPFTIQKFRNHAGSDLPTRYSGIDPCGNRAAYPSKISIWKLAGDPAVSDQKICPPHALVPSCRAVVNCRSQLDFGWEIQEASYLVVLWCDHCRLGRVHDLYFKVNAYKAFGSSPCRAYSFYTVHP